jgi:hypothetical protein
MDPHSIFALPLRSPALVGAKDRHGWVGLFHPDGFIQDPVEAGTYRGTADIETFWDVFIGPQPSVSFVVMRDFFGVRTLIRRATVVNVTEADPVATLPVPAMIRYTLRDGLVGSLQAVWEPMLVIQWFMRRRFAGLRALTRHGARMITRAGVRNGLRFGGTLVGGLGRVRARGILEMLLRGEAQEWASRLRAAALTIAGPGSEDEFTTADAALARLQSITGGTLATLQVDQIVTCGRTIGAFLSDPNSEGALAVMLRADPRGDIESLTAVWSPAPVVLSP